MAKFKRVDYQQVYTLDVYDADAAKNTYAVGTLISHNPANKEIAPLADMATAKQAKDDGLEIYIIAQSDAVTYKEGTPYKTYKLDRSVVVSTVAEDLSTIAAYRVDSLDNIEI